jgi:hypothetical protein
LRASNSSGMKAKHLTTTQLKLFLCERGVEIPPDATRAVLEALRREAEGDPEGEATSASDREQIVRVLQDPGTVVAGGIRREPDVSFDFRTRVGTDTILWQDTFAYDTISARRYQVVTSTMTITQGGGLLNLNAGAATATGCTCIGCTCIGAGARVFPESVEERHGEGCVTSLGHLWASALARQTRSGLMPKSSVAPPAATVRPVFTSSTIQTTPNFLVMRRTSAR